MSATAWLGSHGRVMQGSDDVMREGDVRLGESGPQCITYKPAGHMSQNPWQRWPVCVRLAAFLQKHLFSFSSITVFFNMKLNGRLLSGLELIGGEKWNSIIGKTDSTWFSPANSLLNLFGGNDSEAERERWPLWVLGPLCVAFAWSPCVCIGSLQTLQLPTGQRRADWFHWQIWVGIVVCVCLIFKADRFPVLVKLRSFLQLNWNYSCFQADVSFQPSPWLTPGSLLPSNYFFLKDHLLVFRPTENRTGTRAFQVGSLPARALSAAPNLLVVTFAANL